MQVNLDDSTNLNLKKTEDKDEYVLKVDGRTEIRFSRSELKFVQAMIDSALKEDVQQSRDSLKSSIADAVLKNRGQLQNILRNIRIEDIAFAVWFAADSEVKSIILSNMSKRAAEDINETISDSIERRIRKERSEGKKDVEETMKEQGRSAAAVLLKKILGI